MRRALSTACFATLLAMASATPGRAQDQTEEPPPAAYMALVEEAVTESAADHWAEARSLFREAQELYPNARALRGIGMTSYELRDYTGAYWALTAALAETRRALDEEQRAQVETLLARVNARIGRFTVAHLGEQQAVSVDGIRQTLSPEGYLLMSTGEHQVIVVLTDARRLTGRLMVRGGEVGPLPMEPLAPEVEPRAVAEAAPLDTPASRAAVTPPRDTGVQRAVGWVSVGTSVALVAVGTALVAVGRTDVSFLESPAGGTVWDDVERLYDRSPRFMRGGTALLVLGTAAAATGVVLVVRAGGDDDDDDEDDVDASTRATGARVQARVAPTSAQLEVMW